MELSATLRDRLVEEIRFASGKMKGTQQPIEKLYYFSAVYGTASRIMNIEFDPELGFVHHITNAAYNAMLSSVSLISTGQMIGTFSPNVFSKLEASLDDLAKRIEKNQSTHSVLQDIANLAYSTTGNGYYLYLRGVLKI